MSEHSEIRRQLNYGLLAWRDKYDVEVSAFSKKMKYSYVYAWKLLRGKQNFTAEAFGRFALAYGTDQAQELLDLASVHNDVNYWTKMKS